MIVYATISDIDESKHPLMAKWVKTEDYAEAKLRSNSFHQQRFLLGRAISRALLFKVTGSTDWQIAPNALGKPEIHTKQGTEVPHISLSHTKGLIACAVTKDGPLGIDVEFCHGRDFASLAEYTFGPNERENVALNGASAFYRIWTLREAMSKVMGTGIFSTIDGNDFIVHSPTFGFWVNGPWKLFYSTPEKNYALAMATANESIRSETSFVQTDLTALV